MPPTRSLTPARSRSDTTTTTKSPRSAGQRQRPAGVDVRTARTASRRTRSVCEVSQPCSAASSSTFSSRPYSTRSAPPSGTSSCWARVRAAIRCSTGPCSRSHSTCSSASRPGPARGALPQQGQRAGHGHLTGDDVHHLRGVAVRAQQHPADPVAVGVHRLGPRRLPGHGRCARARPCRTGRPPAGRR